MNEQRLLKILIGPHVSEKGSLLAQTGRQYVFKVVRDATKPEIKMAVEQLLNVKIDSVRVCNVRGKTRRIGRLQGKRNAWKKAYITLAPGSKIDVGEMNA